jgi:transcriptional regulator with XRE-family HTH domain
MKPFSEQLKDAIRKSDMSRYRICQEIGLSQSTMSRFLNGKGWLSIQSIDQVGKLLNLVIIKHQGAQSPRTGKSRSHGKRYK